MFYKRFCAILKMIIKKIFLFYEVKFYKKVDYKKRYCFFGHKYIVLFYQTCIYIDLRVNSWNVEKKYH